MEELNRVDPEGCGCTDCIMGYSKSIDECTDEELLRLHLGLLDNASCCTTKTKIEISYS